VDDQGASDAAALEPVEVVSPDGEVLAVVPRSTMRAERLRHRCTYIVVVDHDDRLIVHRRADWKDVWPGRWDIAFGGVVGVGEPWDDAAARELAEEAGVEADLRPAGGGTYDDDDVAVVARVYLARHDGPFTVPDGEVAELARIPMAEVPAWLDGRSMCPDSVALAAGLLEQLGAGRP
jgi:8-oxo-dGTP pyrophosphatase MutT (NUDIX family)